jgi:hypothetical protein
MSKSRKTAAAAAPTTPEVVTTPVPETTPEVIPAAEAPEVAEAPETKTKTKIGRTELREMGVGLVFENEDEARANRPTYTPATGSQYDLYEVGNGKSYWAWSIDSRRAYEHVCRHLGYEARKADKVARTSQVSALRDENPTCGPSSKR